MGLDQYAYIAKKSEKIKNIYGNTDEDDEECPFIVNDELAYWRKAYSLHRWMYALAVKKGFKGTKEDFNCVMVRLEEEDIENLREEIKNRRFTEAVHDWDKDVFEMNKRYDERFCDEAERALEEGFAVYYDSWW